MKVTDAVWSTGIDDGEFSAQVIQDGDHTGVFTVVVNDTDEELINEKVTLSYGAIFGPDVDDVEEWKARALDAIDEYKEAEGK